MRLVPRIEYKNLSGVVDKVLGLTREVAGIALDHDSLIRSGEAQQVKGTERLKQLRSESKARQHRQNARTAGTRQRQAARSNA